MNNLYKRIEYDIYRKLETSGMIMPSELRKKIGNRFPPMLGMQLIPRLKNGIMWGLDQKS